MARKFKPIEIDQIRKIVLEELEKKEKKTQRDQKLDENANIDRRRRRSTTETIADKN